MNTDNFLEELKLAYASINKISHAIASSEGITDNPDYPYLKGKMETFLFTADHVLGQLKNRMKEERLRGKHTINKNKY